MVNRHQVRAQQVIASFKELIDAAALETITDAQFKELELLVRAAIADELHNAVEQVEGLAHRLHAEVELNNLAL